MVSTVLGEGEMSRIKDILVEVGQNEAVLPEEFDEIETKVKQAVAKEIIARLPKETDPLPLHPLAEIKKIIEQYMEGK